VRVDLTRPAVRRGIIIAAGLLLAVVAGPLNLVGSYARFVINTTLIYSIGTLAITQLAHLAGIWSIGHIAFVAIGAYLTANLSQQGVPVEVALLLAAAISMAIGFVVGLSAGRFSVLYMALLTLALEMVSAEVINRWRSVTGGDEGIAVGPARLTFLARSLRSDEVILLTIALAVIAFLVADLLAYSVRGHSWLAIKSQRLAAMALGLRPPIENALAFGLSGAIASMSGVALAFSINFLSPEAFVLEVAVNLLLCSVVGGVGSLGGALFGGAFLVLVPELARATQRVSVFVFGTVTILVLLFLPEGVVPGALRWFGRRRVSRAGSNVHTPAGPGETDPQAQSDRIVATVGDLVTRARSTLTVKGVSVLFGSVRALDDVSLEVPPGRVVGLIGPNGAGKTTLLNVLSGYVRPSQVTELRLGDTDLTRLPPHARIRHGIGRAFQHAELFHELTVEQTLVLAARRGAGSAAAERRDQGDPHAVAGRLMDALRLRPYAGAFPSELPFGVEKIVDIARAVATRPQLIIMDEPFSGLDAEERAEVRSILRALRQTGVSILLIDHAVQEVLSITDTVVVLDFGRVLAVGPPERIKEDPKVLEAYLGSAAGEAATEQPAVVRSAPGPVAAGPVPETRPPALRVEDVTHRYDGVLALDHVSLEVPAGSVVAILGPNGAGKSTLGLIMAGMLRPTAGRVSVGDTRGTTDGSRGPDRPGIALIPEGRRLFRKLTVRENLILGGYGVGHPSADIERNLPEVLEILPELRSRLDTRAGMLSGGEQQMLAVGRGLMAKPRIIVVDEPSLGLAPKLVERLYQILGELNRGGVTVVVIEQMATHAIRLASSMVILEQGKVCFQGSINEATASEALRVGYFGHYADPAAAPTATGRRP
jgi:branched-chain amino acid transport system permease protein